MNRCHLNKWCRLQGNGLQRSDVVRVYKIVIVVVCATFMK